MTDTGHYDTEAHNPPEDANWAARRELGQALRRMTRAVVTAAAETDAMVGAAELINEHAALLEQSPQKFGKEAHIDPTDDPYRQGGMVSYETSPISGHCNPVAPPMNIWIDGDKARGRVTMDWQYEGPPGCVHGGWVAALFDDFLGMAQKLTGQPGFTGTLNVRYVKPTPLEKELTLLGWVERVEGRKNILCGEMYAGSLLTARAEGLFVNMPAGYLDGVKASDDYR